MNKKILILVVFLISFSALAQSELSVADGSAHKRTFLERIIPNFLKKKSNRMPRKKTPREIPAGPAVLVAPVALKPDPVQDNSLAVTMMPKFYKKRDEAVFNIGLVYYGDYYNIDDLTRVQNLLEERFFKATGETLRLNTLSKGVFPFKSKIENFPDYHQRYITEIDRLQRLWYYDNVGMGVAKEVWDLVKAPEESEIKLEDIDALVVITGAQFDALGFASGRIAVTENPMEIAWGLEDGGRVEFVSDAKVVDELIHEIGHTMYLGHASNQCQTSGMSIEEREVCCKTSEAKDDVMSYCRRRDKVNESFFYGYKECNRRTIKNKIIPALLNGGEWHLTDVEKCD